MPRLKSVAPGLKVAAVILASCVSVVLLVLALLVFVIPPRITINPADGETEVRPDGQSLEITASMWGASIARLTVSEARIAADGTRDGSRLLDGDLNEGKFTLADGSNPMVPDAEYTVTVSGTVKKLGLSGFYEEHVEQTHTFTTITTPMPVIPKEGLKVKYGEEVRLEWNIPVSSFEYQLDGVPNRLARTEEDGRVAWIALDRFEQGKEYPLKITAATSANNIDLKQPVAGAVVTAPPLSISFDPPDGAAGASIEAHPTLVFSEPVSNPDLVQKAVTIEPQTKGSFKWAEPNKLEFVPEAAWEHLMDVTVRVKGGPALLRGISGGFVDADILSTFTTAPYKAILVDISEQQLTLLENGVPVESFLVSTGLSGTDTPMGDYTIYAKLSKTDMRGPGYFAPAVPWVMVFKGDYTIHGNYWATAFGRRSSHGCVGLPVSTAKYVYDWTPIGTPVSIHE